jgi:hypothetical protein
MIRLVGSHGREANLCRRRPAGLIMGLTMGLIGGLIGLASGCEDPPELERVAPPAIDSEAKKALEDTAHREALELALPDIRATLIAAEPLAAWQLGLSPAASPPLRPQERVALQQQLEPLLKRMAEIDESHLPGAEVVILRQMRFGLTRLNDDLRRRTRVQRDPMVGLELVRANLDELRYRLLTNECDAACEALPAALAEDIAGLGPQIDAASIAAVQHAAQQARARAGEARALAGKPALAERESLRTGLESLALACDSYGAWLDELAPKLDTARTELWTDTPKPRGTSDGVARLPTITGAAALVRWFSVEERIDLAPGPAFVEIERHVKRWEAMRTTMLGAEPPAEPPAAVVDVARCQAALDRIGKSLAGVSEVEGPPVLDCARYVALLGDERRTEGQLVLDLLDFGVIEPQRRALRAQELPEVALVVGQWSARVHLHLRRIMLLARMSEPAAAALAFAEGRRALCWAEAALWIHGELGLADEVSLTVGGPCVDLGDSAAITERVTGDPRGALAGFGLSLIGDEPARMVGFDHFFWAPLGTMKSLSTPKGMHPDEFTLPDDPAPKPEPEVKVEFEPL